MTGNPATVATDVYSLGATIYALIAGNAAYERRSGEDLLAHYTWISSTRVPDLRPEGIPDAVCSAIEKAMAFDPAERPASAAEFGRGLQAGSAPQRLEARFDGDHCRRAGSGRTVTSAGVSEARSVSPARTREYGHTGSGTATHRSARPSGLQTRKAPPL